MPRLATSRLAALVLALCACSSETAIDPTPTTTASGSGGAPTTTSSGAAAGTGGAPGGFGGSGAASGSGGGCVDSGLGEPNETESTAFVLKADPINDCDGSGDHVSGVIAGQDDVDWFTYRGNDALWPICVVNPWREIDPSSAGLRVCAFFQCYAPPTSIGNCPGGTSAATSPEGRPGCCGSDAFTVGGLNCEGTLDDDAHVFIRVDHPSATPETCTAYVLSYHY